MNALVGALLGFVLGQVVKFFFEPVYRLREAVGQVDYILGYYADVYMNPGGRSEYPTEARDGLRRAAFELLPKAAGVPCSWFFSQIGLIPSQSAIREAVINLAGLSNSLDAPAGLTAEWRDMNEKRRKKIINALGLHDWFADALKPSEDKNEDKWKI